MTEQEIIEKLATEFFDWQRGDIRYEHVWVKGDDYDHAVYVDDFDPLYDPAACALVRAELRRRGWWHQMTYTGYPVDPIGFKVIAENKRIGHVYADTEERAVCLAVLEACGLTV